MRRLYDFQSRFLKNISALGEGDGCGHQLPVLAVGVLDAGAGGGVVRVQELRRLRQEVVVRQGRGVACGLAILA